ncbi:MAG TPA: hypothetical protein VK724_08895 [Bryobacteraceae bacterium]|nr:hypothetical protein [Bryobacteraceae bacterium]
MPRNGKVGIDRPAGFLRRHRRIALDTSVFIYQLEANPRYLGLTDPVFAWLEQPEHTAVTSAVTMMECSGPCTASSRMILYLNAWRG